MPGEGFGHPDQLFWMSSMDIIHGYHPWISPMDVIHGYDPWESMDHGCPTGRIPKPPGPQGTLGPLGTMGLIEPQGLMAPQGIQGTWTQHYLTLIADLGSFS